MNKVNLKIARVTLLLGAFIAFSACGSIQDQAEFDDGQEMSSDAAEFLKNVDPETGVANKPLCNQTSYWCCTHLDYCKCVPDSNICEVLINPNSEK